ncbi:response regulator transcription factor [Paludibacterium sp. THUN1379]|uniref:response regulator transcription factor n=1 Tax=Paludibacterium sp. THUN1379 TaxID=3112107 RepID=UPI0030874428|nr:response regulator transcription factor [Paludibacterium sp. THUN1379]
MKVLALDSTPLYLTGLIHSMAILAPELSITPIQQAEAITETHASPSVILLDEDFDQAPCQHWIERLQQQYPGCPILITVHKANMEDAIRLLRHGAAGIAPKKMMPERLYQAIRHVHSGLAFIPMELATPGEPDITGHPRSQPPVHSRLTLRQSQILALLAQGASNKQICRQLSLAEGTVKNHLYAIFRLLGVHNRTEAAVLVERLQA